MHEPSVLSERFSFFYQYGGKETTARDISQIVSTTVTKIIKSETFQNGDIHQTNIFSKCYMQSIRLTFTSNVTIN